MAICVRLHIAFFLVRIMLTISEKLEALHRWQYSGQFHPLTCRENSTHPVLMPIVMENDEILLDCLACEYEQLYIPEQIFEAYEQGDLREVKNE